VATTCWRAQRNLRELRVGRELTKARGQQAPNPPCAGGIAPATRMGKKKLCQKKALASFFFHPDSKVRRRDDLLKKKLGL
jgi:hypothetical protein